ncbi:MAG: MFS transporter [Methanobacteriota archaeon]
MGDTQDGEGGKLSFKGNGIILVELAFIAMMVMFIEIMLVPALPKIATQYPTDARWISWVLSAYMLVGAVSTPLLGRLGDMYGKKRVLLAGMVVYITGLAGCALSWSIPTLIAFRAVQGVGMGMFPLAFGIVRDTFPKRQIPVAIGIISAMFSVGVSVGLLGGGYIVSEFSWRASFYIVAPLFAVMFFVLQKTIKGDDPNRKARLDVAGAAMLGGGVLFLLLALTQGEDWGWTSIGIVAMFAASAALSLGFVLWEKRVEEPMVNLKLMANRGIFGANITALFIGLSMFLLFQTMPFFLISPRALGGLGLPDALTVGIYMFPSAIAQLVFAPVAGQLTKRIGSDRTLAIGMLALMCGYASLIAFHGSAAAIMLGIFVCGIGIGFGMVSLINIIALSAPKEEFGLASGMNTLFRVVGGSIGPVLGAVVMSRHVTAWLPPGAPTGMQAIELTVEAGYFWAWVVGAVFAAVSLCLALALRPGKDAGSEDG